LIFLTIGNTCYSIFTPIESDKDPIYYKQINNLILLNSLRNLGINAVVSGRNDIHYKNKKVKSLKFNNMLFFFIIIQHLFFRYQAVHIK